MSRVGRLSVPLLLLISVSWSGMARAAANLLLHLPPIQNADVSGYSRTTVIANSLTLQDGAAYFASKGVGVGINYLPFAHQPFTALKWIKLTGKQMMYGLFEPFDSRRRSRWLHLVLRGTLQPYLGIYINDAIRAHPIQANQWTHITFVYDGKYQMIWVNEESVCARKAKPYRGRTVTLGIGKSPCWNNVPSHDFEGYMKDLRTYNGVLTIAKIRELAGHRLRRAASLESENAFLPFPIRRP